jgi:hypothetical protein
LNLLGRGSYTGVDIVETAAKVGYVSEIHCKWSTLSQTLHIPVPKSLGMLLVVSVCSERDYAWLGEA